MNGDILKPEYLVPVIDPPEGLNQENTKQLLVLYRGETTMSRNIEVELGGVEDESNRVVYFSRSLSLVLQILITRGFVNFSNAGIVSALKKPDLQSSEPAAPRSGFVAKKDLHRPGRRSRRAKETVIPSKRKVSLTTYTTPIFIIVSFVVIIVLLEYRWAVAGSFDGLKGGSQIGLALAYTGSLVLVAAQFYTINTDDHFDGAHSHPLLSSEPSHVDSFQIANQQSLKSTGRV